MKKPQRRLEVGQSCIAGRDDGDATAMPVLQRRDQQRTRFDGGAGDVETPVTLEQPRKKGRPRDTRAQLFDEWVVAVQGGSV
jgi:hypothetical protein